MSEEKIKDTIICFVQSFLPGSIPFTLKISPMPHGLLVVFPAVPWIGDGSVQNRSCIGQTIGDWSQSAQLTGFLLYLACKVHCYV